MPAPAIEVKNSVKRYSTATAVDGVGFRVVLGTVTALLGDGVRKTTTLSILRDLLLPTSGSVHVLEEDMRRHRDRVLPRLTPPVRRSAASPDRWQNLVIYVRL
jgi:ABC-2 type transport system ATP-binding protein